MADHVYKLLAGAVAVLMTTGTVVYRFLEDWSWVDAFYFSSVAVTTVGFGDLVPTRDASKLFTVFYIYAGIGLVSAYVGEALRRVRRRRAR